MRRLPATLVAAALLVGGAATAESAVAPAPSQAAKARASKAKPVCPTRRAPVAQFATCRNAGPNGGPLSGTSGRDRLVGGVGNDSIVGGAGNDDITGGPGWDAISAGDGNDVIDVRDGRADRLVRCGAGVDTVFADAADRRVIQRDCERVLYRAR